MLEATNSWSSVNIDNVMYNGVIFTELKKTFDTIDHDILLLKLSRLWDCWEPFLRGLSRIKGIAARSARSTVVYQK